MQTADDTIALPERLVAPLDSKERAFRIALVCAFLLHAALFVEVGRSVPAVQRTLGDRSGLQDAISVDLVTEADLKSNETVAMPPAGAPKPPAEAAPQPPEPTPKPEPQPEAAQPTPAPVEAKQEEKPPEEKPPEKQAEKPAEEKSALPDFETLLPDIATMPQPTEPAEKPPESQKPVEKQEAAKPVEKKAPQQPAKKQQQARLDPKPQDLSDAPPGRSAGATRPPGITRSGENDEFGRGVIRALRQTMPPPRGIYGRVTVRIILNQNGDVAEVRVIDASGTSIDQNVLFAVKQTYFPLPPYKATVADRTFIITYVYR
ncbi:MAG TPA: TonB family protein [Hyphomicrobium sp.]|nr:TonB family protein [Hyphomicrobium sp.]